MGLDPTFDVFRQVCSLAALKRHLSPEMRRGLLSTLTIGDGYSVLSSMVKSIFTDSVLVLVDIRRTPLFQGYYCQKTHPGLANEYVPDVSGLNDVNFVYCPTEQSGSLEKFNFDIAVNIASMQEMNSSTTVMYFAFLQKCLRPDNLFYCCNRESKTLMGGEVFEFLGYPWEADDSYFVDGYRPWLRYFFGRSFANNGPRLFEFRVPVVNYYDGEVRHRLAKLAAA